MKTILTASALVLGTAPAFAHVGVTPRESKAADTQAYTFRVPSEAGARHVPHAT